MLRWTAGVTLMDRFRNDVIRQKFDVAPIADKMREARLRWHSHVLRGKEGSIAGVHPGAGSRMVASLHENSGSRSEAGRTLKKKKTLAGAAGATPAQCAVLTRSLLSATAFNGARESLPPPYSHPCKRTPRPRASRPGGDLSQRWASAPAAKTLLGLRSSYFGATNQPHDDDASPPSSLPRVAVLDVD
ncbi:unnamed protein product [Heligmosomoides polygyrus]|uniref:Uncharacterized protein n=1 Tax=Heligmosomoides polygyrus TaxID=6339 RepID=A0A183GFY6_HELPZ|nr:unnamed protein product [Heligmosomoides polygyrus]